MPESLPDPARAGFIQYEAGKPFLHYCRTCGAWGCFGYDVDFQNGRAGRWYCHKHRPQS